MRKSLFTAVGLAVAATLVVGAGKPAQGQEKEGQVETNGRGHGQYVDVNGLHMYYEVHGKPRSKDQPPLVLLHGGFSATGTSFGALLPDLAKTRQVISIEMQGHGHTADVDKPLRADTLADDTVAAMRAIGVQKADIFGYSLGASVALNIGIRHPDAVRKLVLASVNSTPDGLHPGVLDGLTNAKASDLYGTPWHEEYLRIAPRPQDFDRLFEKTVDFDRNLPRYSDSVIQSIQAPVQLIAPDSDIVTPEHYVHLFRLLGGGVIGDAVGVPNSQLFMVPGATHVTVVQRAELLVPAIPAFLDAPIR